MDHLETYYQAIVGDLGRIKATETAKIREAGRLIAESIAKGRLLHVFGTGGHSYIAGEEIFWRAGGLVPVNAILEPGVSLSFGARRSTKVERASGWVKGVLDTYGLQAGDVILVVNANGINSATIDAAMDAKERGLTVIAVTSPECSKGIPAGHPARHPSNKDLYRIADLYIDDKVPVGEALVTIRGLRSEGRPWFHHHQCLHPALHRHCCRGAFGQAGCQTARLEERQCPRRRRGQPPILRRLRRARQAPVGDDGRHRHRYASLYTTLAPSRLTLARKNLGEVISPREAAAAR